MVAGASQARSPEFGASSAGILLCALQRRLRSESGRRAETRESPPVCAAIAPRFTMETTAHQRAPAYLAPPLPLRDGHSYTYTV